MFIILNFEIEILLQQMGRKYSILDVAAVLDPPLQTTCWQVLDKLSSQVQEKLLVLHAFEFFETKRFPIKGRYMA